MYPVGVCELIFVLSTITLEINFVVVPDKVIPGELDIIIGWDIISQPFVQLVKGSTGLELQYQLCPTQKVLVGQCVPEITVNQPNLGTDLKLCVEKLLVKYRAKTPDHILTGKMTITLKDSTPVVYRPRRLAYQERIQVANIISELLKDKIIRESHSEYASPIVLVMKKNGQPRMCVDYRDLNKKVVKERYPLPLIQDQLNALCHARYFTTLDMKSGFHQMEIDESSKHITAFVTPDGLYEWNRMPFGYVNSPGIYQRAIDKALGNLKGKKAFVYLDDVLVPSTTISEGLQNLGEVLDILATSGFSLNYEKCVFFSKETEYLGVKLSEGTVRPSTRKVHALTQTIAPTNVKGVRQFLRLAG